MNWKFYLSKVSSAIDTNLQLWCHQRIQASEHEILEVRAALLLHPSGLKNEGLKEEIVIIFLHWSETFDLNHKLGLFTLFDVHFCYEPLAVQISNSLVGGVNDWSLLIDS